MSSSVRIGVVYFANLFAARDLEAGIHLVMTQLKDAVALGLLGASDFFHVVICGSPEMKNVVGERLHHLCSGDARFHVLWHHENAHEYFGIQQVWERARLWAQEEDGVNRVILYFHSKGMTRTRRGAPRDWTETQCFNLAVRPWKAIVERFASTPGVDKIGISCSQHGWLWFNFWWARATYLAQVERPIQTSRRHYYEDWVARRCLEEADRFPQTERHIASDPCYTCSHTNCLTILVIGAKQSPVLPPQALRGRRVLM